MPRKKYTMVLDTMGPHGGSLFSNKSYLLEESFGESLVSRGRARHYEPKRFVNVLTPEGIRLNLSWGEYMKRRKS